MANDAAAVVEKPKIGVWESILVILSFLIFGLANTLSGLSLYARIYVAIGFLWLLLSAGYLYSKAHLFAQGTPIDAHLSKKELVLIWIGGIIYPGITGFITLLTWHKEDVMKARRANIILMGIVAAEFLLGVIALIIVLATK